MKQLLKQLINKCKLRWYTRVYGREIEKFISSINEGSNKIILFPYVVDWNIPLFQRPQHLAKCFARENYTYLFFTGNTFDQVKTYYEVERGLYVVNKYFMDLIINNLKINDRWVQLYSTDMNMTTKTVREFKKKGFKLFYEYIDEISPEIYGSDIPLYAYEKHLNILKDIDIYVVCTAQRLYEEVIKVRGNKRVKLITNGVDINHFSNSNTTSSSIDEDRPKVIGYFGALAQWFDFELILKLAKARPNDTIVLIGNIYDKNVDIEALRNMKQVKIVGSVPYDQLPKHAVNFDVSIIPFKVNEITASTSPIKLFEYMALGKPIVTTDLRECRKYRSVLIGNSHEHFIQQIDKALTLQDNEEYLTILASEAQANTWESKAKDIISLIS